MKFQGFIGPTYNLDSVNVDCQRCVNLYPELVESGTGKEGQQYYYKSTPGLEKILEDGDGPIRLIYVDPADRVFVVSGNEVYIHLYVAEAWTSELLATIDTATGPVSAASYFDGGSSVYPTVFVDGTNSYWYWPPDNELGPFSAVGYPTVPNATHVVLIDGYLVFNKGDSNQFYVSDWNSLNVDPLGFASSEGDPDNIVALATKNRDLWIFNKNTTEVWADTGNAAFPFERVSGGFIEKGCVAPFSVAKADGILSWLGRDESGEGIVFAAQGLTPQRISTHAVEQAIQGYADIASATAFTYQAGGHYFYVLNFTEATWVFDFATKQWHERAYTNEGVLERHRASCHAYFSTTRTHLIGDYVNNKIYQFNENYYSDDGDEITRMRISPHVSSGGKMIFYNQLLLDIEVGVGLDGGVQGSDPQVMLDWSNDGGHTWTSESWTSLGNAIGQIGDYKKRVAFRRLSRARDRVFRIKITDPVKVTILGADLEFEVGIS